MPNIWGCTLVLDKNVWVMRKYLLAAFSDRLELVVVVVFLLRKINAEKKKTSKNIKRNPQMLLRKSRCNRRERDKEKEREKSFNIASLGTPYLVSYLVPTTIPIKRLNICWLCMFRHCMMWSILASFFCLISI